MYKRVLGVVLPIVAAVLAVLTIAGLFVSGESSLNIIIFLDIAPAIHAVQVVAVTIGGVMQAFAVITVIFAVLDYLKVDLKDGDFYNLPEIPEARLKISPYGPIAGIVFAVSTTALFLGFPQVIRLYHNFTWFTIFDTAVIRGLWLPIILWTIVEIGTEIIKLLEGQYTMRLAAVTVITSALQVIFTVSIFGRNSILNPEFISFMDNLSIDFGAAWWIFDSLLMRPNIILMVIVLVVLFFETIDVVIKAFQSSRR